MGESIMWIGAMIVLYAGYNIWDLVDDDGDDMDTKVTDPIVFAQEEARHTRRMKNAILGVVAGLAVAGVGFLMKAAGI